MQEKQESYFYKPKEDQKRTGWQQRESAYEALFLLKHGRACAPSNLGHRMVDLSMAKGKRGCR